MLTGHGTIDTALEAVRAGAFDYVGKPCPLDDLEVRIRRAIERQTLRLRASLLERGMTPPDLGAEFVGQTPAFTALLQLIDRVAPTNSTALVLGETGTGKEMVAKLIHARSARRARPFITVECAALQESLLQSELFGHERGAFTGADRMVVLNLYFAVNFIVVTHILFRAYTGRHYEKKLVVPLVLLSIPMAIGIHTVTAFLYNGLAARPYWNSSILAPQFLASAFCSGPAILLFVLQLLRRVTTFQIRDEAIWKIAELMAYAMFVNLFLHGAEAFKEYYSNTEHLLYTRYWFQGIDGHRTLVPFAWTAVSLNALALVLFIVPRTRTNWVTLNIGCFATYAGCYIEKGMGLIIPGLTPDTLGEIYEYYPTVTELRVAAGVFAVGFLVFTLMLKVAVPIVLGELTLRRMTSPAGSDAPELPAPAAAH